MRSLLFLAVLGGLLAACSAQLVEPTATPFIVYITATPPSASPTPVAPAIVSTPVIPPTAVPSPTATPLPQVRIVAVGDVMLGRKVYLRILEKGDDFTWPFQRTVDTLRDADLTFGNMEGPIIEQKNCRPTSGRMVFCVDTRAVDGLVWAGFDAMSVANNHRWDYFEYGAEDTIEFLKGGGITPVYEEAMLIQEYNGIRIGLIGLDDVLHWLDLDTLAPVIQATSQQVDVLIGVIHWGQEYHSEPSDRQVKVGHALIDAGMDIVVGSHPHQVQPVEEYNGGLIFYSLGNFVMDQVEPMEVRDGDILRLTITDQGNGQLDTTYELLPTRLFDYGQPRLDFDPLVDIDPGTPPGTPPAEP